MYCHKQLWNLSRSSEKSQWARNRSLVRADVRRRSHSATYRLVSRRPNSLIATALAAQRCREGLGILAVACDASEKASRAMCGAYHFVTRRPIRNVALRPTLD